MDVQHIGYSRFERHVEEIEMRVKEAYGKLFCEKIGLKTICRLPVVSAKDLNLEHSGKYPNAMIIPSMLKGEYAVRGMMEARPFVAIVLGHVDEKTNEITDVFVEIIFKRYSIRGDGGKGKVYEDNYVTANTVWFDKKGNQQEVPSCLYASGGMTPEQLRVVRDLLDGKTCETRGYKVKMMTNPQELARFLS